MERKDDIVRYSAELLSRMKSQTNWAKVDAMTQEEIERQADTEEGPLTEGWEDTVILGIPGPKRGVYLRLDPDARLVQRDGQGLPDPHQQVAADFRREPQT